jgi:hypothetical protein
MGSKEWNDDEVKAEIADAVRIVHEDREKQTYNSLHEKYGRTPESDPQDGKNGPPPKKDAPEGDTPKKRRSLYWGEEDAE